MTWNNITRKRRVEPKYKINHQFQLFFFHHTIFKDNFPPASFSFLPTKKLSSHNCWATDEQWPLECLFLRLLIYFCTGMLASPLASCQRHKNHYECRTQIMADLGQGRSLRNKTTLATVLEKIPWTEWFRVGYSPQPPRWLDSTEHHTVSMPSFHWAHPETETGSHGACLTVWNPPNSQSGCHCIFPSTAYES